MVARHSGSWREDVAGGVPQFTQVEHMESCFVHVGPAGMPALVALRLRRDYNESTLGLPPTAGGTLCRVPISGCPFPE